MQKTLEFRKIILIGYEFAAPAGPPILDGRGMPLERVKQRWRGTFAFWIPAPTPYQRCAGDSKVSQLFDHEAAALRDGALLEHVQEFEFSEEPSPAEMRRRLLPVWEGLTKDSLRADRTNGVPLDSKTAPQFVFSPITTQGPACSPPPNA